ncbi:MAG: MFS transporter [Sneathiella sp.]
MTLKTLVVFYIAVMLQAGAYGATFLVAELSAFHGFGTRSVGHTFAAIAICAVFATAYAGRVSHRFGTMTVIIFAGLSLSAALVILAFSGTLVVQIAGGGLLGVGWGLFYTLSPVVLSGFSSPDKRAVLFSGFAASMSIGFGLTPVMSSWISGGAFGVLGTFALLSLGSACAAVLFWFIKMREVPLSIETTSDSGRGKLTKFSFLFSEPVWMLLVLLALGAFVFSAINSFQTIYARSHGWNYSNYYLANTAAAVLGRLVYIGFFRKFKGFWSVAILYSATIACMAIFLMNDADQTLYILAGFLFGIGYGVSYPIILAQISTSVPEQFTGPALRVAGLIYFLFLFGAPYVIAPVVVSGGVDAMFPILSMLVLLKCIIVGLIIFRSAIKLTSTALNC